MILGVYHIAAVNHWHEIVNEQLSLLAKAQFPGPIHCTFTGLEEEWGYVHHVAQRFGLDCRLAQLTKFADCEFPAMRLVEGLARDAEDIILYFHTKGVTRPNEWPHLMWRLFMNAHCLTGWQRMHEALARSAEHDCAGAGWIEWWGTNAFAGNFWMAKAEYIRSLMPFDEYRVAYGGTRWAAEHWINSRGTARPLNFGPLESCFHAHGYWTSHPDLCELAYRHGLP